MQSIPGKTALLPYASRAKPSCSPSKTARAFLRTFYFRYSSRMAFSAASTASFSPWADILIAPLPQMIICSSASEVATVVRYF